MVPLSHSLSLFLSFIFLYNLPCFQAFQAEDKKINEVEVVPAFRGLSERVKEMTFFCQNRPLEDGEKLYETDYHLLVALWCGRRLSNAFVRGRGCCPPLFRIALCFLLFFPRRCRLERQMDGKKVTQNKTCASATVRGEEEVYSSLFLSLFLALPVLNLITSVCSWHDAGGLA